MSKKGQPKSINPLAVIFRFLQSKSRVEIWLYDNPDIRLEGKILGFDEFMNIVLDETYEIQIKTKTSRPLGKLLVKGENVTLVRGLAENSWSYLVISDSNSEYHKVENHQTSTLSLHMSSINFWATLLNFWGVFLGRRERTLAAKANNSFLSTMS